jgi:ornithine carbamoyltransferase
MESSQTTSRNYLGVSDLSPQEMSEVIQLAIDLKRKRNVEPLDIFCNRYFGLIFQGPSLRTKVSFEMAVLEGGGGAVYLSPENFAEMKAGSLRLQGRELALSFDCLVGRIYDHADLEALASECPAPVVNAMSKLEHPCQALGDMLTLTELYGDVQDLHIVCVGQSPVFNSVLIAGVGLGAKVTVVAPPGGEPPPSILEDARRHSDGRPHLVAVAHDLAAVAPDADVIYTDLWADLVDMWSDEETAYWKQVLRPYQINRAIMALAKPTAIFMHCLPAKRGEEVTDEVIDSSQSVVFHQAENRMHGQKALLAYLLDGNHALHGCTRKRLAVE